MPIPHDERIALANRLMREHIDKATRPIGEAALLIVMDASSPGGGLMTYIANAERTSVHAALRGLLTKWDRDAISRGGSAAVDVPVIPGPVRDAIDNQLARAEAAIARGDDPPRPKKVRVRVDDEFLNLLVEISKRSPAQNDVQDQLIALANEVLRVRRIARDFVKICREDGYSKRGMPAEFDSLAEAVGS